MDPQVNVHDLLAVALLLSQLLSWISLRDRVAALSAKFGEFKENTNRRIRSLERPVGAHDRG